MKKERPILFSAPMVRAILEGRKTQTRRVVKPQPVDGKMFWEPDWHTGPKFVSSPLDGVRKTWECPYGQPSDRLWVREAHQYTTDFRGTGVIVYAADHSARFLLAEEGGEGDLCGIAGKADASRCLPVDRWRPSIHMPRWASRITLEVVGVRVERLQDITLADINAEGINTTGTQFIDYTNARGHWADLWNSINGPDSFASNPWVWVVEFKVIGGGA